MEKSKFNLSILFILVSFLFINCSKPTKCECKEEFEKNISKTVMSGKPMTSELGDECDRTYNSVEEYMNEECPGNK